MPPLFGILLEILTQELHILSDRYDVPLSLGNIQQEKVELLDVCLY